MKRKTFLSLVLGSFIFLLGSGAWAADMESGSVTVLSPENGAVIHETTVDVSMKIDKGMSGDHIHFYLDGNSLGVVRGDKKTLRDLSKGEHMIEGRLASKGHVELGPKGSSTFTVK